MYTYEMSGSLFCDMLRGGAANLKKNISIVNDLNVFPIPDGDTGDNMCMTAQGGVSYMKGKNSLSDAAKKIARGMLLSARGNSGVILSQFFEGVSKGFDGIICADAEALGIAFKRGVEQAYSSVVTPTEGTILTVMRESTDYAIKNIAKNAPLEEFFAEFKKEMRRSLKNTPELLPVLKEAGVIDSGGAGFFYIIEGMDAVLRGEEIEDFEGDLGLTSAAIDTSSFDENSVLEFGYCTELLIQLQNSKVNAQEFKEDEITDFLKTIGDSIVCFKTGTIVKLHVHTMTPGVVLEYCQKFGEYLNIKIENMMLQHNESVVENNFVMPEHKEFAVVAVASGEGIKQMFTELGADVIVDGQQTMNPAAEDFITAFDKLNVDNIIVLPNNSNIIMAAKQAAELYNKSNVAVLTTKSIAQGYSALSMMDFSCGDIDIISETMQEAADNVTTGLVTYAVRDSCVDGILVKEGDYIGICDKHIVSDGKDKVEAAEKLFKSQELEQKEVILSIYGADVTEQQREQLRLFMQETYPHIEFFEYEGKQDVYSFIFSIE